jgi:xanthine dehydrogenase accessory factor
VLVDPRAERLPELQPDAIVDARMLKHDVTGLGYPAVTVIGLGPGFVAGVNCSAVIETERGPDLGSVILSGRARSYTGVPAAVEGIGVDRVLRSPGEGIFTARFRIGEMASAGAVVGDVSDAPVVSGIGGVVRGIARSGLRVTRGQKIGDVDPRGQRAACFSISRKAHAIGQGVVAALMKLQRTA